MITLQIQAAQLFKDPYLQFIGDFLIKSLGCAPDFAKQYVKGLVKGNIGQFKDFFKAFIKKKRLELNRSKGLG